jgi:peptide chain release factor 2
MAEGAMWSDQARARHVVEEVKTLKRWLEPYHALRKRVEEARELNELLELESGLDLALQRQLEQEADAITTQLETLELQNMLQGPDDVRDALLTIHPGAGGTESQDWAEMLMRMYTRWAERHGFKVEMLDLLEGEEAGVKSAELQISGPYAYGLLKAEKGVHRLVRISPFDASRRRQTSFASVSVVPEVDDVEVSVREDEIRVDVFRSSGPGGQGVNTADSAVRITHLPTDIVVQCQNERSQLRNRDTAMRILKARLYGLAHQKQREELAELTGEKKEIAFGSQIRSYTFHPYQLIKDHRTGLEIGNVEGVMDGDLDGLIRAYLLWAHGREG